MVPIPEFALSWIRDRTISSRRRLHSEPMRDGVIGLLTALDREATEDDKESGKEE
jgi:hypothetical protein